MRGRLSGLIGTVAARCAVASVLCAALASYASAADNKLPPPDYGTAQWAGLNWGLGIAADFDVTGARVATNGATLVNNVVRVTDSTANVSVGFVLEAHYFLRDQGLEKLVNRVVCSNCPMAQVGNGPFVAIEIGNGTAIPSGNSGPITGYALGWMWGLHHPVYELDSKTHTMVDTSKRSWNLGIGLRVDPKSTVLGDGIVANQPLPAGETAIRFKSEPRLGIMLVSSFSF